MLTETERTEIIDEVERDEWDTKEWEIVHRDPVFHVTVCEEQIPKLVARAKESGKTADEYLSGLIGAVLATA